MGDSRYFLHGLSGELLAEYESSPSGNVRWLRDYVYLGGKLIATISAPQPTVLNRSGFVGESLV